MATFFHDRIRFLRVGFPNFFIDFCVLLRLTSNEAKVRCVCGTVYRVFKWMNVGDELDVKGF